jgi:hypothetical protein
MSRRPRVTPEQTGVDALDGDVRRVPRLRREEVADLPVKFPNAISGCETFRRGGARPLLGGRRLRGR